MPFLKLMRPPGSRALKGERGSAPASEEEGVVTTLKASSMDLMKHLEWSAVGMKRALKV